MKRLLIAFAILVTATITFSALRAGTVRATQTTATDRELWRVQAQRLEQMRTEREQLREHVRDAKHQAIVPAADSNTDDLAAEFATNTLQNLSPEKAERLLAELGLNWNSPGDYLFVSKASLPGISLSAIRGAKLTAAGRAALAITAGEQSAIDTEVQRLSSEYTSWLRAHVQREEPSGDVLAKYVLASDPQFSETSSNAFAGVIFSTLGSQRATLLQQYALNWMDSLGMFGARPAYGEPTSMTVRRQQGNYLMLDVRQGMSVMSCGLTPGQPLPEAFQPLFPGGWKELAERENFELPQEFRSN